jgi:hypothetical protein
MTTAYLFRGNFILCRVFAMKGVQNLKSFWRSSQNYFVLALFCSLHINCSIDAVKLTPYLYTAI